MQRVSVFSKLHCWGYIADWDIPLARYFHWNLIRHFEKHESRSQEKDYSFLDDTFPSLYDVLVYEQKLEREYLERQIYERSLKSEPSIMKFIENQCEHFSKLTLYRLKKHEKTQVFWHQSEARTAATVWNWSGKTLPPGALLAVLYFSSFHRYFSTRLDFPSPSYLPLGLRGWSRSPCSKFFKMI